MESIVKDSTINVAICRFINILFVRGEDRMTAEAEFIRTVSAASACSSANAMARPIFSRVEVRFRNMDSKRF